MNDLTVDATTSRPVQVALWIGQVVLFVQFAMGGTMKLTGHSSMTTMFDDIGAGDGLRILVGVLELIGAIGILIRPFTAIAASGLVVLMIGAGITNVAVLHTSPAVPLVLLVIAAFVAWGRRDHLRQLAQMRTASHA